MLLMPGLQQIKNTYEVYKPTNAQEKLETSVLAVTVGVLAVCGFTAVKRITSNHLEGETLS